MRDTADVLVDLGKTFAKIPTYLSNQYAGMFGISDNMMLALRNGDFAADMEKIRQTLAKAGFDQTSKDAHQFMMDLRDLGDELQEFAVKAEKALVKHFGYGIKDLTKYLHEHGEELSTKIVLGLERLLGYAEQAKAFFIWLVTQLEKLDKATDGWSTRIGGALILLRVIGGSGIIGGILGLAGAFVRLGAGITGVSAAAAVLGGIGLGAWFDKKFPNNPLAQVGDWIGNKFYDATHQKENAMLALQLHGWNREQAAGIVANLNRESALSPSASVIDSDGKEHYGIAQWSPDRQAAFARWAGHDMHGAPIGEQFGFLNHELRDDGGDAGALKAGRLMRDTDNAYDAAQYFSRYFERPRNADAEAEARGQAAINLSAQTTVHVDGSKDPHATAEAIRQEQVRTVSEMTRNLQTAVQ
jgi:hypothetical protein